MLIYTFCVSHFGDYFQVMFQFNCKHVYSKGSYACTLLGDLREKFQDSIVTKGFLC